MRIVIQWEGAEAATDILRWHVVYFEQPDFGRTWVKRLVNLKVR
jgi:hypothetical protein